MIDPQEFALLHAQANQYLASQTGQTKQAQKKKKGNFFTSLIPSAGGIGGAAAGAALGTTILPGFGTLAGALIGGAAGGGAGKVAENAVEGQGLTKGVAGEAALSGVLGAGPLRLAKLGVGAARGVKAGAGLTDSLVLAGGKAAGPSATKAAVANKLKGTSNNLAAKALGLTKAQKGKVLEKTGEQAGVIANKYGIQSAADIPIATKPLYQQFNSVVTSIPRQFTKDEVAAAFKNVYEPMLAKGVPLGTQAIGNTLKTEADNLLSGIKKTISPADLNKKRQAFDKLAYKFKGTDPHAYDVNKMGRDTLSKLIHGAADSAGLKTKDGQTLKQLGQEISKLENLGKQANKNIEGSGGSTLLGVGNLPGIIAGGSGAGAPGAAVGYAANMALNSPAGRRAAARTAERLAVKAAKPTTKNPYSVVSVGKRQALPALLGAAQSSNSQPTNTIAATQTTTPSNANMDALSQTTGDLSSTFDPNSPFAPQNLQDSVQKIISNGGTLKDATEFISLADAIQKMQASSQGSKKPLSAEASKVVSNAQTGLHALDDFESAITQDPSILAKRVIPGRGAFGGILGGVLGTRGADAAAAQIVDVIARLRTGAAITADEAKRFETFIPQSSDPENVRQQKINYLRDQFTAVANRSGNTGSDLESALMSAQGSY